VAENLMKNTIAARTWCGGGRINTGDQTTKHASLIDGDRGQRSFVFKKIINVDRIKESYAPWTLDEIDHNDTNSITSRKTLTRKQATTPKP
jgi:hypothetical protein